MKLEVQTELGKEEVTLPAFLAHSNLTPAEIGMIFLLASLSCDQDPQVTFQKLGAPECLKMLDALKKKGIVSVAYKEGSIAIDMNLDAIDIAEPEKQAKREVRATLKGTMEEPP